MKRSWENRNIVLVVEASPAARGALL